MIAGPVDYTVHRLITVYVPRVWPYGQTFAAGAGEVRGNKAAQAVPMPAQLAVAVAAAAAPARGTAKRSTGMASTIKPRHKPL
jgi:hypothetical protein